MSVPALLLPSPLRDELAAFLEPRAALVDAAQADIRDGLTAVQRLAFQDGPDLLQTARTIATVARSDLATAFSLWCHRMVIEYLSLGPADLGVVRSALPRLLRLERIGSTGLAPAMAHVLSGTPLPIGARRDDGALVLDGKVPWASNLFVPDLVLVTAAAGDDGRDHLVVLTSDLPGLRVAPYPELLALQATASSSVVLEGVRVGADRVLSSDLGAFLRRVRPTFLVLQSSFCWGLARRALEEAASALGRARPFDADLSQLEHRAAALAEALRDAAEGAERANVRGLVSLRLEAACLATESVALELKAVGSRAYARSSGTSRRLREAAFLPIQAPTEGQLRAELGA